MLKYVVDALAVSGIAVVFGATAAVLARIPVQDWVYAAGTGLYALANALQFAAGIGSQLEAGSLAWSASAAAVFTALTWAFWKRWRASRAQAPCSKAAGRGH